MKTRTRLAYAAALLAPFLMMTPVVQGQDLGAVLAPAQGPCPVYKSPEVQAQIDKAFALVGDDLPQGLIPSLFILPRRAGLCAPARVPAFTFDQSPATPVKAFDQLYFVGNRFVGAWALKTSGGIILFDAMNNADDVDNIVEPGLRGLGLDPAEIKYVVISHGHGDHYGGARRLQEKYGAKVWVGDKDAPLMSAAGGSRFGPPPQVDKAVTDGTTLILGDTTVKLFVTAGHTPASLSAIFPVTDNGAPHKVAIFGGYGLPNSLGPSPGSAGLVTYIAEAERFQGIGEREGVDVGLSTHPIFDDTIVKTPLVSGQRPKVSPWVLGREGWVRYSGANIAVAKSVAAMMREREAAG